MDRFEPFDKMDFKKLPAKERDEFLEVLQKDLQENGLTECNRKYILRGNVINTAKVFCEWLSTFDTGEERFQLFESFLESREFKEVKKDLRFSFLTKVMAYLFCDDERYYKVLYGIIDVMQDYLYSTPGIVNPQRVNVFGRNFLTFANPESGYPDKEAIGVAGTTGLQKKRMLSSVFYAAGTNAKKGKGSYVNHLKAWLNDNVNDNNGGMNEEEKQAVPDRKENKHNKNNGVEIDKLTADNISEAENAETIKEEKPLSKGQSDYTEPSFREKKKKKLSTRIRLTKLLNEYFEEVTSKEEEYMLIIDNLQNENGEKRELINQYKGEIKILNQQVQDAKNEIEKLNTQINKLEIGMKKQANISNIVQADLKSSSDERLKALGSRLKGQYEDFQAACELEITQDMACDLAEMLKSQLHDVFEILMNDGITFNRR